MKARAKDAKSLRRNMLGILNLKLICKAQGKNWNLKEQN